jgi:hypothetical protein
MDAPQGSQIAALAARLEALSQVCARLSAENAELRTRMSQLTPTTGPAAGPQPAPDPGGAGPARAAGRAAGAAAGRAAGPAAVRRATDAAAGGKVSRRMMGKALGAAAAGVVGAVALADATASPAAAATGDAVKAGNVTTAEAATTVKFDGTNPGCVFLAHDTELFASDSGHSSALAGWAGKGQVRNGVYGFTEVPGADGVIGLIAASSGNGVHAIGSGDSTFALRAENDQGTAIYATSGGDLPESSAAMVARLTSTSPLPSAAAVTGICNGQGVNGIGVFGGQLGQGRGVSGHAPQGVGVEGGGSIGVLGAAEKIGVKGSGPTGVRGVGTSIGISASGPTAVHAGGSGTAGVGVSASGSGGGGRGGVFAGNAAQVQLAPGALASHPRSGKRGDLYADKSGRLWFCKKTGNPALWHQLA